jgi:hypothetical protein
MNDEEILEKAIYFIAGMIAGVLLLTLKILSMLMQFMDEYLIPLFITTTL